MGRRVDLWRFPKVQTVARVKRAFFGPGEGSDVLNNPLFFRVDCVVFFAGSLRLFTGTSQHAPDFQTEPVSWMDMHWLVRRACLGTNDQRRAKAWRWQH